MNDGKVRIRVRSGVGLRKVGPLAEQVGVQLLTESSVSGLGEQGLLFKDGKEGLHKLNF